MGLFIGVMIYLLIGLLYIQILITHNKQVQRALDECSFFSITLKILIATTVWPLVVYNKHKRKKTLTSEKR